MLGGFNVEDILASLYPQETEAEMRRNRRRDILAGVGQVFSALDVGATPDVSNIRAQQEERRRQATIDMRERERARAAASLVYSQTGDAGMAGAIATGAISYGDVVSERERKRIEAEADRQRLAAEQQAGRLAGLVESAWSDLGLPDSMKEQALASIAAGDDPETIFTLQERKRIADEARKVEEAAADSAQPDAGRRFVSRTGTAEDRHAGGLHSQPRRNPFRRKQPSRCVCSCYGRRGQDLSVPS
jgi:hypothetical protein